MIQYKKKVKVVGDKLYKKRKRNIEEIYSFLESRNYEFYIKPIEINNTEEIYPYIIEYDTTSNERAKDLIYRVSILHNKTTEFREKNIENIKELYETTINILQETYDYYYKLQDELEEHELLVPEELLLLENISKVYFMLNSSRYYLEEYYKETENNNKERVVRIHGNLSIDHIIESDEKYLISWNNSRMDYPIIDLVKFYKKDYEEVEFSSLLHLYQLKYPLLKDEINLFFSLINIPEKIRFTKDHLENTILTRHFVNYMDKTIELTLQENKKDEKSSKQKLKK